jgi:peptidoglycan hydrolase-like protein with peptidoglycan-binding domain
MDDEPFEADPLVWHERLRDWVVRHPRDTVALVAAVVGSGTIAINALFLQTGPHPAPLFALRPAVAVAAAPAELPQQTKPQAAAAGEVAAAPPVAVTRVELVAEIQRELARRGLYGGAVDGIYGPKTDAAVRDFAQTAHLKLGAEPSEALLRQIVGVPLKEAQPVPAASMSRPRRDPIADLIGPSPRILSVQRALTDFGYGQIKPTGVAGADTASAIEKFERARKLPVTGQMSDRLVRELAAVTGRPLE